MKKYIGIIMVLGFILTGASFAEAQEGDTDTGGNTCANIAHNLRYGMRDTADSSNVSMLQDFLNSNGYLKTAPSGFFGKGTLKAVQAFQKANKLSPTGFVGSLTRGLINRIDCDGEVGATISNTQLNGGTTTGDRAGCHWVDASTLTTTDGALGQTCLSWAQSFAGAGIGVNKISASNGKSTAGAGCGYEHISSSNISYSHEELPTYTNPNDKPIRNTMLFLNANPVFMVAHPANNEFTSICVR